MTTRYERWAHGKANGQMRRLSNEWSTSAVRRFGIGGATDVEWTWL